MSYFAAELEPFDLETAWRAMQHLEWEQKMSEKNRAEEQERWDREMRQQVEEEEEVQRNARRCGTPREASATLQAVCCPAQNRATDDARIAALLRALARMAARK